MMTWPSAPPSGTVTLLFTDIEGSTRLLQRLGDRYRDVLSDHRRILRQAWFDHDGAEVDTAGDSFFVTFARASDALAAAIQGQRDLAAHPWPDGVALRVRMGIHTGEPELTGRDYVGIDVHRAARISAAGHGGQVLVSRATVELLPPDLPGGATLIELGEYALKGLAQPERLYQLTVPGLASEFPELKTAPLGRTNLPASPDAMVGREDELAELRIMLGGDDVRLLTLTGSGGTGKTRLALTLAAEASEGFVDGAYMVDLAAIDDPSLVLPAIAHTLPLGERPADPLAEWLADHLADRQMLIVLDNFEQVMGASSLVADLLSRTLAPKLIVTSREPLRVAPERTYPVPPLAASASIRLFVDRARDVRPDFELTEDNGAAVAEICVRLDGLPLAIELAAPWVRVLEPQALVGKLGDRLDLLTHIARDLPERQRTLRGAIDWSYRLLNDPQQTLFRQLGIFAGGWSLDAAERVCDLDGAELLFGLGGLIDKNLVRREPGEGGDTRFSMFESIRAYARERMEEQGEVDAVAARHADVYRRLAERAGPELYGPTQTIWMVRLSADLENLRAAMTWASASPERAEVGLPLVGALALFWFFLGQYREGFERTDRLLETGVGAPPAARVTALLAAGLLGSFVADPAVAQTRLEEGLALAREIGDASTEARCLDWLGLLAFFRDDVDGARDLLERSIAMARGAGDLWCLADALGTLGSILPLQGAFAASDAASAEALSIARGAGDEQGVRMALFGHALTAVRRGDLDRARDTGSEGLAISRSIGDVWFISYFQWLLALERIDRGYRAGARAFADNSLEVARLVEAPLLIACALEAHAGAARMEGDLDTAWKDLEEARAVSAGGGVPTSYLSSVLSALGTLALERGEIEEAERGLGEAVERARSVGDPWAEGVALLGLAQVIARREPQDAGSLVAQVVARQAELGSSLQVARALKVAAGIAGYQGASAEAARWRAAAEGPEAGSGWEGAVREVIERWPLRETGHTA
jgi:predicted ATPase/class 3 adenylate cyclase